MVIGCLNSFRADKIIDLYKLRKSLPKNIKLTPKQQTTFDFFKANKNTPQSAKFLKENLGISKAILDRLEKNNILEIIKTTEKSQTKQPNPDKFNLYELSAEQQYATDFINSEIDKNSFSTTLIEGITGSGKTEVFFHSIAKVLKENKGQVLILLPEIVLTSQIINRFEKQFGFKPAVWHSQTSTTQKKKIWTDIQKGNAKVIVGARSALFLPFQNLSLIIIDEEHDGSFKQTDNGAYHGRDMAIVRAKIENIPVVLSSATPSIETLINAKKGKYAYLKLPVRFGGAQKPTNELVDLRKEKLQHGKFISSKLREEIETALLDKKQSLLYMNRRGYAPLVLCKECGHKIQCPNCNIYLTEHRKFNRLTCHHCGHQIAKPNICPECKKEDSLFSFGPGVEKIAEEIAKTFPNANIGLITSDTIKGARDAEKFVQKVLNNEINIIIGTQLIAKGHHFPKLTLVGIIDADASLFGNDIRASERTYQMLTQVSGRAGREKDKGKVILQTYSPENLVLQAIMTDNKESLFNFETTNRKIVNLPPFGKMASITTESKYENVTFQLAKTIVNQFPKTQGLTILGPNPAQLYRINNRYRYKIFVKTTRNINIQTLIRHALNNIKPSSTARIKIDIDPYLFG
jgi:primosomal protein N' (replication factor Y)